MDRLPVVFVHGIRLSGAAWVAELEQVGARRPVLAVDLPGHGARRGERFTLTGAVNVVADAVDGLGGRALIVGHSLGGYVAIAAVAAHPERVAGLVIAGSTLVPTRALTTPFLLAHRVLSAYPDGGEWASGRMFDAVLPPPVAQAIRRGGIATEVIPDVMRAVRELDVLASLTGYPGPTWLINGGRDHFRGHERRFLAACGNGRLFAIPGAGHLLPMTHAARFSRHILDIAEIAAHSPARPELVAELTRP
jgi:pimeloyl-ACP methyl ester carboxylesterase